MTISEIPIHAEELHAIAEQMVEEVRRIVLPGLSYEICPRSAFIRAQILHPTLRKMEHPCPKP